MAAKDGTGVNKDNGDDFSDISVFSVLPAKP
jgi:hypothetical protein